MKTKCSSRRLSRDKQLVEGEKILVAETIHLSIVKAAELHFMNNLDLNIISIIAECDTCLAGMNLVHYILSEDYWVKIYMIAAEQICQSIASESLKNTCQAYVNNYLNKTLDVLAKAVNPDYICKALQACANDTRSSSTRNSGDSILCEGCKSVYNRIQSIFTDHTVIKEMKSSVKVICLLYAADESQTNVLQDGNTLNEAAILSMKVRVVICLKIISVA
ncbi:saposin containing protein [Schistosoma mansoni]|uniref:saposin containing protein n=1 Tax=Schistosoma mansoni TaxID=6183 RepID=UPI00022DC7ED|nr:saposin containing protein [Schistosoma mansoni]|eukprot:XP_018649990.1 saposin containing protein [Schistosoma mansoni]